MEGKAETKRTNGGEAKQPRPPFPEQHQDPPGLESELEPRPRFEARQYRDAGKLVGKVALITGGDSGIGRAVATMFAREGAAVAINYLAEEQSDADETRDAVEEAGGDCLLLPGDVTEQGMCESLVDKTVERFGAIDVLVSNAAHQQRKESLDDLSDEELEHTFDTNIFAYVRLARAANRVSFDTWSCLALAASSRSAAARASNASETTARRSTKPDAGRNATFSAATNARASRDRTRQRAAAALSP